MQIKAIDQRQRRYRDVLIGVSITILLVLFAEIGARSYFCSESGKNAELGQRDYGFNYVGYGDLMPNQDGMWTIWPHRPYHVQTNAAGLRNAEPLNDGDVLRVLAIGDSMTFGPYVANEDTWPGWLQSILRQRLESSDIEVLNAGICGYTIEDELAYFGDKGQALTPDIVILGFFPNDIYDVTEPAQRPCLRRPASPVQQVSSVRRFLSDHVALYRLASRIKARVLINIARSRIADEREETAPATQTTGGRDIQLDMLYVHPESPEYRAYYQQYSTMLHEFIAAVSAAGSQLVIVAIPGCSQVLVHRTPDHPQRFVEAIANDRGTPYLDLIPAFRASGEIEDLYLQAWDIEARPNTSDPAGNPFFPGGWHYVGNGHLSRFGYRVAARAIADFLFAEGLISADAP